MYFSKHPIDLGAPEFNQADVLHFKNESVLPFKIVIN